MRMSAHFWNSSKSVTKVLVLTTSAQVAETLSPPPTSGDRVLSKSSMRLRRRLDHVSPFFGNHDDRCVGVSGDHRRHDRRVDDAQSLQPTHAQFVIDDSHRVVAHLACPADMKCGLPGAPGVVYKIVIALALITRVHLERAIAIEGRVANDPAGNL